MQLNVALSGVDSDPIGFVQIDAVTDLAQLRGIIRRDLPDSPGSFRFLSNGVQVSESQEERLTAADFMPLIVIQPTGGAKACVGRPRQDWQSLLLDASNPPPRRFERQNSVEQLVSGQSNASRSKEIAEMKGKLGKKTRQIKALKAQIEQMRNDYSTQMQMMTQEHARQIAELHQQIAQLQEEKLDPPPPPPEDG